MSFIWNLLFGGWIERRRQDLWDRANLRTRLVCAHIDSATVRR